MNIRQANLVEHGKFRLEEVPEGVPGPDEVLVRVVMCGICGSDIHAYHGKHAFIHCPIVLGHEFTGVVKSVGEHVKDLTEGQKVVVEPNLACGECYNCQTGRYHVCENLKVIGCQAPGAYADSIVVPRDKVLPIPDEMDFDTAVLVEPLAVGVHAVRRSGLAMGDRVLVFGVGPIGLMTLMAAKSLGAKKAIAVDILDGRLELAKEFGADAVCNPERDDVSEIIAAEFGPEKADITFECSASEKALNQAIDLARKGTSIVQVGCFGSPVTINNMSYVQEHELTIVGTMMYRKDDYQIALQILGEKRWPVKKLITHRFPLEQVAEAFRVLDEEKDKVIKAVLVMDGKEA